MRRHATVLATALAATLLLPGHALAVWTSVNTEIFQVQHVCRDGMIIDVASQRRPGSTTTVRVSDLAGAVVKHQQVTPPAIRLTDVPVMSDPVDHGVQTLGRDTKVLWPAARAVGSQVKVGAGDSFETYTHTVRDCSVHQRFDPFTVGYLLADDPAAASYPPSSYWSYNSRRLPNRVLRTGVGVYTAEFAGLAGAGGNAQVTAFGDVPRYCKIGASRWYASGTAVRVDVRCHAPSGAPADARFTASYTAGGGSANTYAFLLADQPGTAAYTPNKLFQDNNSGAPGTVTRFGPGGYDVLLPNIHGPRDAGSVKVTAVGASPVACGPEFWGVDGAATRIRVRCTGPGGQPADQQFALSYMDGMNVLGSNKQSTAYVWAEETASESYTPHLSYQRNTNMDRSAAITAHWASTGVYRVALPSQQGSWDGGTVHVTAYGSGDRRCQISSWYVNDPWTPPNGRSVGVLCFTAAGAPANSRFTLQYTAQIQ